MSQSGGAFGDEEREKRLGDREFSSGLATVACREKRQRPLPRWGKTKGKRWPSGLQTTEEGLAANRWVDFEMLSRFDRSIPFYTENFPENGSLFLPKPLDTPWTKFAQFPASDASKSSLKFSPPSQRGVPLFPVYQNAVYYVIPYHMLPDNDSRHRLRLKTARLRKDYLESFWPGLCTERKGNFNWYTTTRIR